LQCIELIKLLMQKPLTDKESVEKSLARYKNASISLALPLFTFSEPIAAPRTAIRDDWSWTLWDFIEIKGDITLKEFLDVFRTKYRLDVSMLSCGKLLMYSSFLGADKKRTRMGMKMSAIVEDISRERIAPDVKNIQFVVCCSRLEDDADVDIPPVHYILP
jgi:ubiquitin-activating enzyme E1